MLLAFILAPLCTSLVFAASLRRQSGVQGTNDGIHLAIGSHCGSLSGNFADVNSGLPDLASYKTIVAFGDSYTDTGGNRDGTPPPPPIVVPPNAEAGGRSSNGLMWGKSPRFTSYFELKGRIGITKSKILLLTMVVLS